MVITLNFDLNQKTSEAVANLAGLGTLTIAYENAGWGAGEDRAPIYQRINIFLTWSLRFMISVEDPKGMKAVQRLKSPKVRFDRAVRSTFTKMLA